MRRWTGVRWTVAMLAAVALLAGCASPDPAAVESRGDAETAADGFVYGYAPVALARTRANMTCLLPVNQLYNQSQMAGPESRTVVAPNVDTLYSIAWLDLRSGPVRLTHPDLGERYFGFQFLDIYSNVVANVGTRETGTAAGTHLIVPPGWSGDPGGARVIESPTWDVWMIGRTLVTSESDLQAAQAAQRQYTMQVVGPAPASVPPTLPPPDCGNNPAPQTPAASGAAFYDELAAILAADPPPPQDEPLLERIAELGVTPGATPSAGDPEDVTALAAGVAIGMRRVEEAIATGADGPPGSWSTLENAGRYGTDYLQRAVVARIGLGANVPEESTYHVTRTAADGQELQGVDGCRLHFAADALPPVDPRGFWSITLYGPDMFLVPNALGRYAIGDRTPGLVWGADGSLDVQVSASPPVGGTANWLPAPDGEFVLMLRSYLPTDPSWNPPAARPESQEAPR
ncbi:DUF1254 domain-containing protein [Rhodococcus sp. NPDC003318]|uniref:DUF1254 domain-containing protein n=1 Tax=Rhodococcus sp. NPDC003318 TaxID=3364503 RepID=UPI0036A51104